MSLVLSLKTFGSRTARKIATNGKVRTFIAGAGALSGQADVRTNGLWNGFLKFGVSLLNETWKILSQAAVWSAQALWGAIVGTSKAIFNFNWNPSDAQLDNNIKSAFASLAGQAGGFLGKATGYLLCGALPGLVVFAFNEPLGAKLLQNLGEEALPELASSLASLLTALFGATKNSFFAWSHKNFRTLWRESDSKFKKRLEATGLKKQYVDEALEARNKPFIIREMVDKKVEAIKTQSLKNFIENFLEEFDDTCVEAGYVIAGGIDAYAAERSLTQDIGIGRNQNIEVQVQNDGSVKLKEFKPPVIN